MIGTTGADLLMECLTANGIKDIFGIPGVQLDPAIDAIYRRSGSISFTCVRNEQAATYMADGYARASGGVGVAMVVPGPGTLNALAGLATAYATSSPVLLIAGQIPVRLIGRELGALHEIPDQTGILQRLTKWTGLARSAEQIPDLVAKAFHELRSGRPRPVALEVPMDVLASPVSGLEPQVASWQTVGPTDKQIDDAVHMLQSAARPVIIAGGGTNNKEGADAVRNLAEIIGAPVVCTAESRGVMPADHHLAFDPLSLRRFRETTDVVLAVGTRLTTSRGTVVNTGSAPLILINVDENDLGAPRQPSLAIRSDASTALTRLAQKLDSTRNLDRGAEFAEIRSWSSKLMESIAPQQEFLHAIRDALPRDGIVVNELTQIGYVANLCYPAFQPRTFIGPGYQGTLGSGFATALGVQAAKPGVPVVSINGDGGFSWTMQELSTARRYNLPVSIVVFNDSAFGNVKRIQGSRFGGRYLASDLENPDYLTLAKAFGIAAESVTTPDGLRDCLRRSIARGAPTLIEVPVGEFPDPWPLIHE